MADRIDEPDPRQSPRAGDGTALDDGSDELARRDTEVAQYRAGRAMSVVTLLARITGFARILVVSAVFGTSFLGATYQTSNNVPNLVFELVAAGALSSVLVPTLVDHLRREDRVGAERLAGGVLGCALALMAVITVVGIVLAEPLARLIFVADDDATSREDKIRLGTFFLRVFLPQTLFYVVAMVMTGVLQAHRRFVVPALAPLWNNVVVITVYVVYGIAFAGQVEAGSVTTSGALLLGLGTTLGVAALALPQIPFVRHLGFRVRPRIAWRDPGVRRIARLGAWAIGWLGFNSLLLQVMVSLANRGDNVVPLQVAWAFFLLPYSLFAMVLATAAFPALSSRHAAGDSAGFDTESGRVLSDILFWVMPSACVFLVLAGPISTVFRFGSMTTSGAGSVALYLRAFSIAVPAFCLFLGLTRIAYARNDTRSPTLGNGLGVAIGIAVMVVAVVWAEGDAAQAALGFGTALAYAVACVVVAVSHLKGVEVRRVLRNLALTCVAAAAAGLVMFGVETLLEAALPAGRGGAALVLCVALLVGGAVYLAVAHLVRAEGMASARSVLP
ncbi:MAG: polysaccharide biosynthesis C-terminal domain-containing protein [Acidimicrobiia bacterium]|nr:polysaccharide biosynthesis C-terminal domain-containing protein [Acidimicrobiia bacterium]